MADQSTHPWRQTLKRRLMVATVICAAWSVAIEARLFYLQVIQYDFLAKEARKQHEDTVRLEPKRGDIVDRQGNLLAYNVDADSAYANPREVEDPPGTVAKLCSVLRQCADRQQYVSRLAKTEKQFAWLTRRISPNEAAALENLRLKGIYLSRETRRYYPKGDLAGHLLGFVGDGNAGLAGLERKYQELIGGSPGRLLLQVDSHQRAFNRVEQAPVPGASLILTIDSRLQHIAERELAAGVEWSGAESGSVIIMDPMTGEVLAAASSPAINPNAFNAFDDEARMNRAFQYTYEPGSTFKIVTASAALEERVFSPDEAIDTNPGHIRFGSRVIDEAKGHNYGVLPFEDVIVKSSNVGAVKIGLQVGARRLADYVARFGFGRRTSKFFQGESSGLWDPSNLPPSELASVSMGYRVGVTPIQMAAAVSVIANGGELLEPRLVSATVHNGVRTPTARTVVRRVISRETAATLTTIMEGVVSRGTAKAAQIEGFTIAGKTGTAAKTLKNGGYSKSDYNVSFVGFLPSRNPVFTILVVIDSPHKVSAYGGSVAAPVFQKIAAAALRLRGVPPSLNRPAPVLIARRDAIQQHPVSSSADAVVTLADAAADAPAVIPSLIGMSARDATRALVRLGVSPQVNGNGFVVNQRPAAGTALDDVDVATVWLDRRSKP